MKDEEWFAAHAEYLVSTEWQLKREKVLERDHYRCTAQMSGCSGAALQVHHLSYRHWRDEPLFDLASVCTSCHERITSADRVARPKDISTSGTLHDRMAMGPWRFCAKCRRLMPCADFETHGISDVVLVW